MCIDEWKERGYVNNMKYEVIDGAVVMPPWMGDKAFHLSHRSNLVRKLPERYGELWPDVPPDLPYIWPV